MDRVLCIDIGGTRIKSAILRDKISLKELRETNVKAINSIGWLNSSLPLLLNANNENSLIYAHNYRDKYDRISIGVPLSVDECGNKVRGHYVRNNGVPVYLKSEFEKEAKCNLQIISDIEGWIKGVLNYFILTKFKFSFPCLFIICGTAVGIGYAESSLQIESYYFSKERQEFINLGLISNETVSEGWEIHKLLGKDFFIWTAKEKFHWHFQQIQQEYTSRIAALLKDMETLNLSNYYEIKTIFIGGGSVDYISDSICQATNKSIVLLKEKYLKIDPSLLPLLGLII